MGFRDHLDRQAHRDQLQLDDLRVADHHCGQIAWERLRRVANQRV